LLNKLLVTTVVPLIVFYLLLLSSTICIAVLDLGLGRSIYSKAQVEEFLKFQDSQETRRTYLTETA
jgi:hypothetical protein